MSTTTDLKLYTPANLLEQTATAPFELGYYHLTFYVDDKGLLAKSATDKTDVFYYSPSGGTLRDGAMNIVLYSAKFDIYKGLSSAKDL